MRAAFSSLPCSPCPRRVVEKQSFTKRVCQEDEAWSYGLSACRASSRAAAAASAPSAESLRQTDQEAATADDSFPNTDPDAVVDKAALPTKSKYAVVEIGGIQMFVEEGRWYNCNRLQAEPGQTIQLGRVLAVKENGNFSIGAPYLENAVVKAQIVEDLKGPKLTIFKMRAKKHYRRKTGHRQPLTQFYITEISV